MPGSYTWKSESIWHPKNCQCNKDPNYVFCSCYGNGGYFAGPLNPTEYIKELAIATANREAQEAVEREALEKYKSSQQYVDDKALLNKLLEPQPTQVSYTSEPSNEPSYIDDPKYAARVKEEAAWKRKG
ncbi:hypothetical protein [Pseudomonas sp. H1h]|uniref:hypothetical protein n=1 Tax=Pseudomonas sp. H1h TaxID=1397280 RepID=UPI0012FF0C7A|nr:hypothetical protein [Pseudomonas sp. H1h]